MSDSRDASEIFWVEPRKRAIIPIEGFRLSRSLRKTLRSGAFDVTRDTAFAEVIRLCADREETWINEQIEESFIRLHELGYAHSIECWQGGSLVGGLYGVRLGGAFFGESMFSTRTDASKIALAWLVARLKAGGFRLLDCQFMTEHLRSLGAIEISQKDYLALLASALSPVGAAGSGAAAGPVGAGGGAAEGAGEGERVLARGEADFGALERLLSESTRTVDSPPSGWVIAQLLGVTS
jgi:leucyl/phenylalanyl-tRNA--protein transferase